MTNILNADPSNFRSMPGVADGHRSLSANNISIWLLVLIASMWVAAVIFALFAILLLIEVKILFVLGLGLALLGLILCITARRRIYRNPSLRPIAGCPSCQKRQLIRVRRTPMDRLITLTAIRVARYQCRDCTWNGIRIYNREYEPAVSFQKDTVADPLVEPILDDTTATLTAHIGKTTQPFRPAYQGQPQALTAEDGKRSENSGLGRKRTQSDRVGLESDFSDASVAARLTEDEAPIKPVKDVQAQRRRYVAENREMAQGWASRAGTKSIYAKESAGTRSPRESAQIIALPKEAIEDGISKNELVLVLGSDARIMASSTVDFRDRPRPEAKRVGSLKPNASVTLLRRLKQSDGTLWYYIRAGRQAGWVTASYLIPVN